MEAHRFHRRIRQHVQGKEHLFFAVVQPGFEYTAQRELASLGVDSITGTRDGGVEFRAKLPVCYGLNLRSRTVSRVLMRLLTFRAANFDLFRKKVGAFPWELYIDEGTGLSFSVSSSGSRLYHTRRIEDECRRGIAERLVEYGVRLGEDENAPLQRIFVRMENDRCALSLDSSGELLYRRNEKIHVAAAPLRETLASLILMEAGVEGYDVILDPMCGSGTFSLEGAGILLKRVPGEKRSFAFMKWPCFSEPAFNHLLKVSRSQMLEKNPVPFVFASDVDQLAVENTRRNLSDAGLERAVDLRQRDFFHEPIPVPPDARCLVVLNPPYGPRLGHDTEGLYRVLGRRMREWYGKCGYAIITPSLEHEKILSLPYDKKILFKNGGIDVAVIIKKGDI